MGEIDRMLAANEKWAQQFPGSKPVRPARAVAVVACMDSRMPLFGLLGLEVGDAHVIRNAGGVITEDTIRSLTISQHLLGTREIVLVHHTDCGLSKVNENEFREELAQELGLKPWWSLEAFSDVDADVRQSMQRLQLTPFIPHKDDIRGFVYEVETGRLREVNAEGGG